MIDLYPEVQAVLEQDELKIEDLVARREVRGLPVLTLEPPLRFAVADETPRQVEVTYGLLAVRHGCDDSRALVCSSDRQLQVVLIDPAADNVPEVRIENR